MELSRSYFEVIKEIVEFTNLDKKEVEFKVWNEIFEPGWNVYNDAKKFNINFHTYNEEMEHFYEESYGFVFETTIESLRTGKRRVLMTIKDRINNYLQEHEGERIKILMMGDGVGEDTTYLFNIFNNNADFYYFDVPGSKTYEYAIQKFKKHNIKTEFITIYGNIPNNFFDVLICLEVLEHLPNPEESVKNMNKFLKHSGISLITESFGNVETNFPTHLKSNLKYSGKTPFLFLTYNLFLRFYSKEPDLYFRPMEFIKKEKITLKDKLRIYMNRHITLPLLIKFLLRR